MLEQPESAEKGIGFQGSLEQAHRLRRNHEPLKASRILIGLIQQEPTRHAAYAELAMALFSLGLMERAIGAFGQAIKLKPNHEPYYVNFSAILHHAGHYQDCIRIGGRALELNPQSALAHINLGLSQFLLRDWKKGLHHFEEAVRWDPDNCGAWVNLGLGYENQAMDVEANRCFENAFKLEPGKSSIGLCLGTSYLKVGRFKEGWEHFSARFQADESLNLKGDVSVWQGESLEGKSIHLYPEQGLGDLVQFIRFAKMLSDQGARVIATVPKRLRELVVTVPGIEQCFIAGEQAPPCDFQSTVMELPRWLGIDSSNIPLSAGYLTVPPVNSDVRAKLESLGSNLKVGVVWSGNPNHVNDSRRSMCFEDIAPLLNIPNLTLVNLQMGSRAEQLWEHPQSSDVLNGIHEGMTACDTASLVRHLDLVITVDTFVAHMAGALGVPTWILLARNPDWRWLGKGEHSHWYDSVRLFRQGESSYWAPVVEEVVHALQEQYPQTSNS